MKKNKIKQNKRKLDNLNCIYYGNFDVKRKLGVPPSGGGRQAAKDNG